MCVWGGGGDESKKGGKERVLKVWGRGTKESVCAVCVCEEVCVCVCVCVCVWWWWWGGVYSVFAFQSKYLAIAGCGWVGLCVGCGFELCEGCGWIVRAMQVVGLCVRCGWIV